MSFYTSLTGLNAAATELSVASNNIANSGTASFKRSDAEFGDIFATSTLQRSASGVGSGTVLLGISQQFTQGNIESSANSLDLAITGDGFFPIKTSDGAELYTRNGGFMLNDSNLLVNSEGHTLQVHPLDAGTNASNFNQATIGLEVKRDLPAVPTTKMGLDIKLPMTGPAIGVGGTTAIDINDSDTYSESQTFSLYDDAGEPYTATVYYQKTADDVDNEDTWKADIYIGDEKIGDSTNIAFNSTSGDLVTTVAGGGVGIDTLTIGASVADSRTSPITLTLSAVSHGKAFQIVNQTQNGLASGGLVNVDVGNDGMVTATYSNGQQLAAGRINLANFSSPEGLRQDGGTKYSTTASSGAVSYGEAGSAGFGTIRSGAIERSNVDLTGELIDLISAQRNFQANAKAIETSSSLTQTIINIRG
ncbi:MAG: flagellar hook protein FlgE [Porticoccaceae bacterium]|mgnify:CR=1 FL=1|nr:flagellar hook protein FlgE [Porticoccaceae bacterium]